MSRTVRLKRGEYWYRLFESYFDEDDIKWVDKMCRDGDRDIKARRFYRNSKNRNRRLKEKYYIHRILRDKESCDSVLFPHERKTMEWDLS